MIKNLDKWLSQSPKEAIDVLMNGKKIKVIPQKEIETLLDKLTDRTWTTQNFKSSVRQEIINGKTVNLMDASLELVISYTTVVVGHLNTDKQVMVEQQITRTLVGAVTFDTAYFGNTYHNNTARSMCIVNAASDITTRFGKYLNPLPAMLGMNQPTQIDEGVKDKIGETLNKLSQDLSKKTIG